MQVEKRDDLFWGKDVWALFSYKDDEGLGNEFYYKIAKNLKSQNKVKQMNILINEIQDNLCSWRRPTSWNYEYIYRPEYGAENLADWYTDMENCRNTFMLIDKNNTAGLSESYDFYLVRIANTYQYQEKYKDAAEFYKKAIGFNPNRIESYIGMITMCKALKDSKSYLDYIEKALEKHSNDAYLYYLKAEQISEEKPQEAIVCYTMGIDVLNREKKSSSARFDVKRLMKYLYSYRGYVYKALGMQDKADADELKSQQVISEE
jgi:tetratricopeptide (TPR) repeat protein